VCKRPKPNGRLMVVAPESEKFCCQRRERESPGAGQEVPASLAPPLNSQHIFATLCFVRLFRVSLCLCACVTRSEARPGVEKINIRLILVFILCSVFWALRRILGQSTRHLAFKHCVTWAASVRSVKCLLSAVCQCVCAIYSQQEQVEDRHRRNPNGLDWKTKKVVCLVGSMMPRAATPESKSPSTPSGPMPASAARPKIGFSIDFLVGTGGNNNKRNSPKSSVSEATDKKKSAAAGGGGPEDGRESSPVRSVTPDSSRSASPTADHGSRIRRLSGQQQQAVIGPGSPLFQSWNPASVIPASSGHHPPPYLDMAALANLRQLYEQQQQQHPGSGRPNFFPPHHPGSAFSPANFPPPPQPPPGQSAMAGNSHGPAGMSIRPDQQSSLAAQQWWLLAQARQHQQRLFAAAAVASHRFPPGTKSFDKFKSNQRVITRGK